MAQLYNLETVMVSPISRSYGTLIVIVDFGYRYLVPLGLLVTPTI